jgi:tetratricopeptide (TPR) repeat protein
MDFFIVIIVLIAPWLLMIALHELGHAIPALIMSGKRVSIFIGTEMDKKKLLRVKTGKLKLYFSPNPWTWAGGCCDFSRANLSINQKIVCLLAGPLTPFMISITLAYFTTKDMHGAWKAFAGALLLWSVTGLTNLVPSKRRYILSNGDVTYNDGHSIRLLLEQKKITNLGHKFQELFERKKYDEALKCGEVLLRKDLLNIDGLFYVAFLYAKTNQPEKAIQYYDKILEEDPLHTSSLNNKAYTLNLLERFQEAIPIFDKVIEIAPSMAYPYNNRGLSKIKIGQIEEGLADINHSFELDPNNSYAFRNIGVYYFDKGMYAEALKNFKKAKEMDETTHLIDQLINDTEVVIRSSDRSHWHSEA